MKYNDIAEDLRGYRTNKHIIFCQEDFGKTAMMFEATAPGVEAEPLMRLQMRYNVRIAQKDKSFIFSGVA